MSSVDRFLRYTRMDGVRCQKHDSTFRRDVWRWTNHIERRTRMPFKVYFPEKRGCESHSMARESRGHRTCYPVEFAHLVFFGSGYVIAIRVTETGDDDHARRTRAVRFGDGFPHASPGHGGEFAGNARHDERRADGSQLGGDYCRRPRRRVVELRKKQNSLARKFTSLSTARPGSSRADLAVRSRNLETRRRVG